MSSPQLAPAGSSQYTSDTMYVGDGTWDTERNTFLLPNLVGLNFNTMRYNGMGNRFRELPQYHNLIRGHAVVAAITFLLIVPSAILIMRFHDRDIRSAVRIHVWLQVVTVLLTTVVFALGWFAVGPNRSLSNPHHGIGLAIYVLVLAQVIGGWWIHSKARKRRIHETLKAMIHRWFGRMIALLGLAQIPLGLTLYGSPLALFILYALAVFTLLFIYFILSYLDGRHSGSDYSYSSGSAVEERRRSSGLGGLAKAGLAGAGLVALSNRFRRRSRSRGSRPEVVGSRRQSASRRHSGSYIEDEKYSRHRRDEKRGDGWKDRLLKIGAIAGVVAVAKNLMDRRRRDRDRDRDSDVDDYGPPLGGATPINPERLEEGRPLPSGQHPLNQPLHSRRSTSSSISRSSYMSASGEPRRGHGLRDTVVGLGAFGLARNIFKNRRERKEQRRLEAQRQKEREERRARTNNPRLTGDGFPRRNPRRGSLTTSTDYSASTDNRPRYDAGAPPPVPAGVYPAGVAGAAIAGQELGRDRHHNTTNPSIPIIGGVPPTGPVAMPPMPPDTQGIFGPETSGSEAYNSAGGRQHRRHRSGRRAAATAPVLDVESGAVAPEASSSRRDRHHSASGGEASVASPPVSVKVKMHRDGRHVTLRRLPEEEAAAERTRRSKDRHGKRRKGSISSLSGSDGGGNRWRRTEARQREQAEAMRAESENLAAARAHIQNQTLPVPGPPPPPIHESSVGAPRPGPGSVGSPGTYDGTATDASANYRDNRKRRRAERSQAKLAKDVRQGNTVEFE